MQQIPTVHKKTKTGLLGWCGKRRGNFYHSLDIIAGYLFDTAGKAQYKIWDKTQI